MTDEVTTGTADTTNDAAATSTTADTTATAAAPEGQQQQGTEVQAAAEKPADTKPEGAPEAYEFKAPEGREFDPEVVSQFAEVAKELNLTQDAAQKVLDKMGPALLSRQMNAIQSAKSEWTAATKSDSEIGGVDVEKNIRLANTTFEKFGTPELLKMLLPFDPETNPTGTGLGDHPEMIRWAHRVGKAMSEDGFVAGRNNTADDSRNPQKLYSKSNMNP